MTINRTLALFALAFATIGLGCTPNAPSDAEGDVAIASFEVIDFDGETATVQAFGCETRGDVQRYAAAIDGARRTLSIEPGADALLFAVDGPDGELLLGERIAETSTRIATADGRAFNASGDLPVHMVEHAFDRATLMMLDAQVLDGLRGLCLAEAHGMSRVWQGVRLGALNLGLTGREAACPAPCDAPDGSEVCCCDIGEKCVGMGSSCWCESAYLDAGLDAGHVADR